MSEKQRGAKRPAKIIAGIFTSIIILAAVLLAFTTLGWPSSLITLAVMLGVAWLVGALPGEKISASRWPPAVAALLAVGLAVSTVWLGVPWKLEAGGEDVWFKMEASFTYRGSEDNLPIENVAIRFPCPNVENEALPVYTTWALYYQEEDNTLTLQADQEQVYEFRGERTENLEILSHGWEPTVYGPKINYIINKIYPREVFFIINFSPVTEGMSDKATLQVYEDNQGRSGGYYWYPSGNPTPGNNVDIYFWAQLSKKIGENNYQVIETFSRTVDNANVGWLWWLYPTI